MRRWLGLIGFLIVVPAFANKYIPLEMEVEICESHVCHKSTKYDIDPQARSLTVKGWFVLSEDDLATNQPMALYVVGKMSSLLWLNSHFIGQNGQPGTHRHNEAPGAMDWFVSVPVSLLKVGKNELIMDVSGHHSIIDLAAPIHWISLGAYGNPTAKLLIQYRYSIATFGALLLALIYLLAMAFSRRWDRGDTLLAMMSGFALLQLTVEISRGFWQYSYPFHDIRLMLILLAALGFSMSLSAYVIVRHSGKNRITHWLISILSLFVIAAFVPGFDNKTGQVLLFSSAFSMLYVFIRFRKATRHDWLISGYLLLFVGLLILSPGQFLDQYFYIMITLLLAALAWVQAREFRAQQVLHQRYLHRAEELEKVLSSQNDTANQTLMINTSGHTHAIESEVLIYCTSDRDYVEFITETSKPLLSSSHSLAQLEQQLEGFIRVHRSYLVNRKHVVKLVRKNNGAGVLELSGGKEVPVSRRIVPLVRKTLVDKGE